MTIECNPQAIDIDQSTEVFITLKNDEGKPVVGQNIFVGVTGIKGSFSFEMLTTNSEGEASTTFTPQEYGMGYIIAKASIRQGTSILSITAETTIKVDNMNKPPTAKITNAYPNPVSVGETIQFTGEGDDIDGKVTEWKWDMGDGTVFTGTGDVSSVTHIYEKVGDYKVTFIVKDNSEIWSNPSWVTIKAYTNNAPQIAKVGEWENTALTGHEITISALITDPDSNLAKCVFDWGDGTTEEFNINGGSATLKSTHKYNDTGIYYVKIFATDLNESATVFPLEGWKINVYGKSKGGIKILFPDSAGEQIDFIGPFPSRDVAISKILKIGVWIQDSHFFPENTNYYQGTGHLH
ncbi:MAG: PKD domain-containing protein [Caldisericia bacterium]